MIATLQKNVTTSGTPVQIATNTSVISGTPVVIKAKSSNTGKITLGRSSADSLNSGTGYFGIAANEAVEVAIANLNEVWIDAQVNGEGVEVIYEPHI